MARRCPTCGQRVPALGDTALWAVACGLVLACILFTGLMILPPR